VYVASVAEALGELSDAMMLFFLSLGQFGDDRGWERK
jgi:hypothetical protein